MSIKINNKDIVAIYKGEQIIYDVYKGTDLVWEFINDLDDDMFFVDPEVGRVLHANGLIKSPTQTTKRELRRITSLNPSNDREGSYFYNNKVVKRFPELQYFINIKDLSYAFWGCTSLTEVVLPRSVTNLESTFRDCSNLTTAPIIPNSVTRLYHTFNGCSSLIYPPEIPNSVENIRGIFDGCSSLLIAPVLPEGVTDLSFIFSGCKSLLKPPIIPEGVIYLYATFQSCTNLTEVPRIPVSVIDMDSMFRHCVNIMRSPRIPINVVDIMDTFYNCPLLDGNYFIDAVKPPRINIYIKEYDTGTFYRSRVVGIYVPDESVNIYKTHKDWSYYASKIYPMSTKP